DMERTRQAIGNMYERYGYLMDTHTAVGYRVYKDYVAYTGDKTPNLIASTASAYKFAGSVAQAIGIGEEKDGFAYIKALASETGVPVPTGLQDLDKKEIRHKGVVDPAEMEEAVFGCLK
ncbi:MAG: threonine synthase, partial [Firmicutes bacterium]|nr:threonine synthase [Bacillota bacterium]